MAKERPCQREAGYQEQRPFMGLQFSRCSQLPHWDSSQAALDTHSLGLAGPESVKSLAFLLKRNASHQPALVPGQFLLQQFPLCFAAHRHKPLTFVVQGGAKQRFHGADNPPPMTS